MALPYTDLQFKVLAASQQGTALGHCLLGGEEDEARAVFERQLQMTQIESINPGQGMWPPNGAKPTYLETEHST